MRVLIVSLAVLTGAIGDAAAQEQWRTWEEPSGRLSFSHPPGWVVTPQRSANAEAVRVAVGAADYECEIWALPRTATLSLSAEDVRARYRRSIGGDEWRSIVSGLPLFRAGVEVGEPRIGQDGDWPIERTTLRTGERTVRGALQGRPGVEFLSLCLSFDGEDRTAIFELIENSIDLPGAGS